MTALKGAARRRGLQHFFDTPDDARTYRRANEELRALLMGPEGRRLVKTPESRRILEQHATLLFNEFATVSDSYRVLKAEAGLFNDLIALLTPKDLEALRVDAHHVIEEHTFDLFRKDWELLGWTSADDMAAIPVFNRFHRRSPKRLPGVGDLGRELDAMSLTQELLHSVDPKKAKDVFELIDAYKAYYEKGALRRALPVLKALERELARRGTAARLVRDLKSR